MCDNGSIVSNPPSPSAGRFNAAPVTLGVIALNVLVYIAMVVAARSGFAALRMPTEIALLFGANESTFTIADGRIETLLTSCFLHGSILHIGLNMWVLRDAGSFVERAVGPYRFVPLYLVSGVGGSVASALYGYLRNPTISVGASGAVCGVVAAAAVLGFRTQGVRGPLTRSALTSLAMVLFMGVFQNSIGASLAGDHGGIDNAAHVGGALSGAVTAALWRKGRVYGALTKRVVVAACALVTIGAGAVVVYRDRTDPYLFLTFEGRLRAAVVALDHMQCAEAQAAQMRAARLRPKSALINDLNREIELRCGTIP